MGRESVALHERDSVCEHTASVLRQYHGQMGKRYGQPRLRADTHRLATRRWQAGYCAEISVRPIRAGRAGGRL